MDEERYIEALNACSLESYEGYFEELCHEGKIQKDDLAMIEALPVIPKATAYTLAILACPKCTDRARDYARQLLLSLV